MNIIKDKKKLDFRNSGVYLRLLFSYLLILSLAIIYILSTYTFSKKMIEKETNAYNNSILNNIRFNIDSRLRNIQKVSNEVALNKKIQSIIFLDSTPTEYQNFLFTEIIAQLHDYKVVNGFIDDISIFLPNINLVLKNNAIYNDYDWYKTYYSNADTYNKFITSLQEKHYNEYIVVSPNNKDDHKSIRYLQSLPIDSSSPYATLVVDINKSAISEYLKNLEWISQGGTIFIIDKDDKIISYAGNVDIPIDIDYSLLANSEESFIKFINGKKHIIIHKESKVTKWTYVFIIPQSIYYQKLNIINIINIFIILSFFIFGGLLTIYFSKKNYKPINKIVNIFNKLNINDKSLDNNEYHYIENAIKRLIKDRKEMFGKVDNQKHIMRNEFIINLLKGKIKDKFDFDILCTEYDLDLVEDGFAIILIKTKISDYINEADKMLNKSSRKLSYLIVQNVFEKQAFSNNVGYVIEKDNMYVCLVNINIADIANAKKELLRIANDSYNIINLDYGTDLFISISNIHSSFISIPNAFTEAKEILQYKCLIGGDPIIEVENIDKSYEINNFARIDYEKRFKNSVIMREFSEAKKILNIIFEKDFFAEQQTISLNKLRYRKYTLISHLLEAIQVLTQSSNWNMSSNFNPETRLLKCNTITELRNEMHKILDYVNQIIESEENTKTDSLVDCIKKYIYDNYDNTSLNVSKIADEFGVSITYLSKIFKKSTGTGLLKYIHNIRINHAKELLRNKDLLIKDIAQATGYYNAIAFIRVFKEQEGISPGRYQKYYNYQGDNINDK